MKARCLTLSKERNKEKKIRNEKKLLLDPRLLLVKFDQL